MNILTLVIVVGAAFTFSAYLLLRFSRQIARLSNAFIRLPASQKVVLILGVTIATVSAQKGGTNDVDCTSGGGTNAPPLLQFVLPPSTASVAISSNDVLRGYRLESVSLNPYVTYTMPDGAAVVGTWHLTGAYEDVVRVGIGELGLWVNGWSFPLGTHLCDSLWAYTWGMARPQLKNFSNEIAAVGAPMSAIPDVSRFWTAATTNGSRLLTWENFCGGCCAEGEYLYEGYSLPAYGGYCACCYEDDPGEPHQDDTDDPPVPVGVSAGFSRKVIFFEDAYANATNQTIPWYSQVLELSCAAYGGPNGGSVSISLSGDGSLIQYGGQAFPISRTLQPYEVFCFTNTYRAVAASGSANDIVVTANFVESETGWTDSSNDRATAVKVEVKPVVCAPENESDNRHGFGIGEVVRCMFSPDVAPVSWISNGQGVFTVFGSDARYRCPFRSESNGFKIGGLGSEYTPSTWVVEPSAVLARDAGYMSQGTPPGQAGGILLTMTLHALPLDVSFSGVEIEEIPDADASRSGYFSDSYFMNEWYHGRDQHAGVWSVVTGDNQFLSDEAGFLTALPQLDAAGHVSSTGTSGWTSGTLTWEVPCGWAAPGVADEDDPVGTFAAGQLQVMSIDGTGNCEVHKHSNVVRRTIDGHVYLNGVLMQ